jgi:hypothetical protein
MSIEVGWRRADGPSLDVKLARDQSNPIVKLAHPNRQIYTFWYEIHSAISERDIECQIGEAFRDLEQNRRDAAPAECEWQVDPEPTGRYRQMGRELSLSDIQYRQRFDASSIIGLALGGHPETARSPVQEARSKPRFHQSDRFTNGRSGYPQTLRRSGETSRLNCVREREKALEATRLDHEHTIAENNSEDTVKISAF